MTVSDPYRTGFRAGFWTGSWAVWVCAHIVDQGWVDRFRECANPTCRRLFLPIRRNRRYCRVQCSNTVAKRAQRAASRGDHHSG